MKKAITLFLLILSIGCNNRDNLKKLEREALQQDALLNFKQSVVLYGKILAIDSLNVRALTNRGRARIDLGDTLAGLADLDKAIAIHPQPETILSKAMVLSRKDPAASVPFFNMAYKMDSTNKVAIGTLVNLYSEILPQKDSFLFYGSKVDLKQKQLPWILYSLMSGYLLYEKHDKLIEITDLILEADPKDAFAYNNRGYAKLKTGRLAAAQSDISRSLVYDSLNSYAYRNMALLFIRKNKIDSTCYALQKARALGYTEKYGPVVDSLYARYCKKPGNRQ